LEYVARRGFSSIFYFRVYRVIHPTEPYLAPATVRILERKLDEDSRVFEWGSGASTLWFAERVGFIASVEHDRDWYQQGLEALEQRGLTNTELHFVPPVETSGPAGSDTMLDYGEYVAAIDDYEDGSFDCILVDGRSRNACVQRAIPKLAESGLLILDDSHRTRYNPTFELLADWHAERKDFGLRQTTVFTRP
jgi:predicted O-methyltransferase YrrM